MSASEVVEHLFISRPKLEPVRRIGQWRLLDSVMLHDEQLGYSMLVEVPFYCDLASVPNTAWPLLQCNANHMAVPGFWHDAACRTDARLILSDGTSRPLSFDDSLHIISSVMEWNGICGEDRWIVVSALKVVAPTYWHKKSLSWRPPGLS